MTFLALCLGCSNHSDLSGRIKWKIERPLLSLINPHVSDVQVLIVDGKRFERVRGGERFYFKLPQINSITFITDEKDYSVTYHIYNLVTKEDIGIRDRDSMFGHTIGYPDSSDSVEAVQNGQLVLCYRSPDGSNKTVMYLNLDKKEFSGSTTYYYDQTGKVADRRDYKPSSR
ncbi:hypothetical protein [Pedosphaera parvula]|uniref:hypothetical protein n=1 Tax=Pedosphaera parvula TaxID=1032527 RepID=UPI001237344A|nr:hypothetical protein [Pedosphaera parvula]